MKSLIILVTILSSYLAVDDLIPTEKIQSKQNENIANTKLKSLSSLTGELDIEKEWKKEKRKLDQQIAERNKPKKPKAKPKKEKGPAVPELTIAGVKYKLLAVSISTQEPYILLKPNNKPLRRVAINQKISNGITLLEVHNDKIKVALGENTKQFKLFERKTS